MPGVPSGRGCDACRKQKKKCDQKKPACARCTRLHIPCVGSGQQRYKFLDQGSVFATPVSQSQLDNSGSGRSGGSSHVSSSSSSSSPSIPSLSSTSSSDSDDHDKQAVPLGVRARARQRPDDITQAIILATPLSDPISQRASSFVRILDIRDLRYNIRCYGFFFDHLPRRMGQNPVLDKAIQAMAAVFPYARHQRDTVHALSKYGKAIGALRDYLSKATQPCSLDTLCAIYIMMLCQIWLDRREDNSLSHGQGLASILNTIALSGRQNWDTFEEGLFLVICTTVALEVGFNPKVKLGPAVWNFIRENSLAPPTDEPLHPLDYVSLRTWVFSCMMRMVKDPELYEDEIRPTYNRLREELKRAFDNLDLRFQNSVQEEDLCSPDASVFMAQAASILGLHTVFNGILQAIEPENAWILEVEFSEAFDLQTKLAHLALPFRPLGSSHMISCLIATRAVAPDVHRMKLAEELLVQFGKGYLHGDWENSARSNWLRNQMSEIKKKFEERRKLTVTRYMSQEPLALS